MESTTKSADSDGFLSNPCANPFILEEIVEHVLKFLPMKALNRMTRVSKLWHRIAKKIKCSRQQLAWFLYVDKETGGVDGQIGQHLEVLASEPFVALLFCSSALNNKSVSVAATENSAKGASCAARSGKRKRVSFMNYLQTVLPASCHILGLIADGVIGTYFDRNSTEELETKKAASCLLLPHLNGVDIYSFKLNSNNEDVGDWGNELNSNTPSDSSSSIGTKRLSPSDVDNIMHIPADKNVRLVLLFLTEMNPTDSEFGRALVRRYGNGEAAIVVAGGYGDSIITYSVESGHSVQTNEPSPSGLGIAFCGNCIHVTSVILQPQVCEPDEVEKCLRKLGPPPSSKLRRKSVGLMFACVGRGQQFYDNRVNVESAAFARLYPGIPLLGFFGNGEIGYDFPDGPSMDGSGDSSVTHTVKLFHSYTSIFVLVSFG